VLLTGPFGGLTDDVREFLLCLADEGLPITGWGELEPASLRTVRERLPGGGAGGDGPGGLALARRRTALLRSLCDAGGLAEADAGLLQLTPLGREFLDLPDAAQLGFVFAAWWEGVDWATGRRAASWGACSGTSATPCSRSSPACPRARSTWPASPGASVPWSPHRWPSILMAADPAERRQALWSTALAPLAMLGALDVPARMSPSPSWFALTGTAPALVAAAAAMSGPELPPSLAAAAAN
jgi:hypothetical protein